MKVVFVVGPTASGKSQLALELAQELGGAIVNCDSIQLYQKLEIGSAMPTKEERKLVPHFLFDQFAAGVELTVGDYHRHFFAQIEQIKDQFPVVFVVGGTGFYFQAIEKGLYQIGASDEKMIQQIESELASEGSEKLYAELLQQDPQSAKKISVNDHYRLCRAIEIIRTHGKTKSEVEAEFQKNVKHFPFPLLKIGISAQREILEPIVRLRTQKMLNAGLVDEVKQLVSEGFRDWGPLESIGYRECLQFIAGAIADMETLKEEIIKNTLRLGKKQRTWFQRDKDIHWFSGNDFQIAKALVRNFLKD